MRHAAIGETTYACNGHRTAAAAAPSGFIRAQFEGAAQKNVNDNIMSLSLVVCTRNRAEQLARCLDAVSDMKKPEGFELIVVDNASTDHTSPTVETFASRVDFSVRYTFEKTPGLGNARNRGWRMATGQIISFTDDDCYVDQDFAPNVLNLFRHDEQLGYLGGRILLFDPFDLRITIRESTATEELKAREFVEAGVIQGANFSFRRRALEEADGFDPLLGSGTPFPAEDVEMVGRLSALGWSGLYSPEPVVYHHHGRKSESALRELLRGYDRGRGAYYMAMMVKPGLRLSAAGFWFHCVKRQAFGRSVREIEGAIGYLWTRVMKGPSLARRMRRRLRID